MIRKAYTIAKDTHAQWHAVYVLPTGLKEPTGREKVYLTDALNLAEQLGAKIITLSGRDIADEILQFARDNNITRIVIGKPLRSMLMEFIKGSPVIRLLYARSEFELHMIAPTTEAREKEKEKAAATPSRHIPLNLSHYLMTTLMVIATTALNALLEQFVDPFSLVFLYLIPIITAALLFGIGPSVFSSFLSLLIFDFFLDRKSVV